MSTDFVSLFTGMSERDIGYLLKNIVQRSINTELTNSELSNVDNKTPVLLTNSKDIELINDIDIQTTINIEAPTQYIMPEEPDGKDLKIWLKFQNAGELRDWSYQKNKAYAVGANTMPGLFYRSEDNNMIKTELYSYFNGASHYGYVVDAPPVQIKPNIVANKITSFFLRLKPLSLAKLLYAENNSWFTKTDDDQLRYGYSVTIDVRGNVHFYVKNDYRQYHLFLKDAYNYILSDPLFGQTAQFRLENFNRNNFLTAYEALCSIVDQEPPFDDWFFKYNPTNHNMSVLKTVENNPSVVFADTSLVTPVPVISLPIQEGKYKHDGTVQTTLYDNSGNNRNATLVNITTGGEWNDDNTLTSLGVGSNNLQANFGSISAINTMTEFTITFWFNPLDELITPATRHLVRKSNSVAQSFSIFRNASANDIRFVIWNTSGSDSISATFPNAFPQANTWYFICARWKTGEKVKISVNNAADVVSSTQPSFTYTNSGTTLSIFRSDNNSGGKGKIALFRFYTTQISDTVKGDLYYEGYHNPLFPKSENIQPEPFEPEEEIFIPFSNIYNLDKMTTPVAGDYRKINSLAGDNPLVQLYSVADGSSVTDPELNPYTITDGVVTGGGSTSFTQQYICTDTENNSFVQLSENDDNAAAAIEVSASNSALIGKKITKAIFYLRAESTPTGTVRCKVWNTSDQVIHELWHNGVTNQTLNAANVEDSEMTAYTFQNTNITGWTGTGMAIGWKIGIEYDSGGSTSDQINVKRNQSNPKSGERQASRDYNGDWANNSSNDIVGELFDGGTGTASVDPNIIMKFSSYNRVTETFGTGDTIIGKVVGKVTLRLKKVGSPTGTATIAIMNNASPPVIRATLGTIDVSTLTTTTADYTFTNYTHGYVTVAFDRVGIIWTPSISGEVHVMTNLGTNSGGNVWNGNNSAATRYISSWNTVTGTDLAGKIYTGGNNFDAFLRFSETRTRIATKAVSNQSSLHNDKITKVVARIKKVGAPGGIITARIRDPNDVQRVLFSSVDVSTIPADGSYHDVEFTNFTHTYLMNSTTGSGDKVVYEFSGAGVSNYIELNSNKDVLDSSNLSTITQTYDNGNYVDHSQRDLAGKMYSGGEPDLNSRTRVAQSIEHQDSRLKGKKITKVQVYLYRANTSTSGTVSCNIRRGTDDSLVKTLGTFAVSSLSSTVGSPTLVPFEDTTNNYPMTVGDKVTIDFTGGSATNFVGVLVRNVVPNYDGSNSYIRKYDEIDYDDEEPTMDLCGLMDEGGFFFTPDPSQQPDPTPVNDKDLIICAGNNKVSGFFEAFIMEFRIYTKDINLDMADNLYANRYSISPISPNSILMPISLKANTLDPV